MLNRHAHRLVYILDQLETRHKLENNGLVHGARHEHGTYPKHRSAVQHSAVYQGQVYRQRPNPSPGQS